MPGPVQQQRQLKDERTLFASLQQEESDYAQFQQQKRAYIPPDDGSAPNPAFVQKKYSSLSKDEKKAEDKKYEQMAARNTFVSGKELETPYMQKKLAEEVKIDGRTITQDDLYREVKSGNCTHMQKLDTVLRNRAATEYITAHPINGTPEEFVDSLFEKAGSVSKFVSEMMNPLLRMGISLVINSPDVEEEVKAKYRQVDELLNTEIMIATLNKKVTAQGALTPEIREKNIHSQVFMMKTMLSCHLGSFIKRTKGGNPPEEPWPHSVANAFAHCSRVVFTMPEQVGAYSQYKEDKMLGSFYGGAGFYKRDCATHSLSRKKRSGGRAKEIKFPQPFKQYGMDVAVGGLGNSGIPGDTGQMRAIKNDGSCGHLYMHLEKGNEKKQSGMLIGFESDAVGVMNQTGHVHDSSATPEFASSFGGQRCDEIGDKYGGREVDLSHVNIEAYTEAMTLVTDVVTKLYDSTDPQDEMTLNVISRAVCGSVMDDATKIEVFRRLYEASGQTNPDAMATQLFNKMYGIVKI